MHKGIKIALKKTSLSCMVGMVWQGVARCGMVWYGMHKGFIWYVMISYGIFID